jgi:hypothetical protein
VLSGFAWLVLPKVWLNLLVAAEKIEFQIIPEAEKWDRWTESIVKIKNARWEVMDTYVAESNKLKLWEQFASWIMNWDTILDYAAYLVKFLANVAMVIGSWTVIYAGYLYVMAWYNGDQSAQANSAIKYAVIGIVVVIFSYAIMRILISAFL